VPCCQKYTPTDCFFGDIAQWVIPASTYDACVCKRCLLETTADVHYHHSREGKAVGMSPCCHCETLPEKIHPEQKMLPKKKNNKSARYRLFQKKKHFQVDL